MPYNVTPLHFRSAVASLLGAVLALAVSTPAAAVPAPGRAPSLRLERLRDRVGETETVNLNIYLVGFPPEVAHAVRKALPEQLNTTSIVDAKPWWIPNIPTFGAADFALAPAPDWLPPEVTPPDGMLRYDALSFRKVPQPDGGPDQWLPLKELEDVVEGWHDHADVMNYVEHAGSYRDVAWKPGRLRIVSLDAAVLHELYARWATSVGSFTGGNPAETYALYSYNDLFDWLAERHQFAPPKGGASIVLLNLAALAGQPYTFAVDSMRDRIPSARYAPIEVQYPPSAASSPENQAVANLLSGVLGGGLTQAKMAAALDVECVSSTTAQEQGLSIVGMKPTQALCGLWQHRPIRNLLAPAGQRHFVSDSTTLISSFEQGASSLPQVVARISDDFYELYRFGVMAPTIKANSTWSAAKELRTAVVDLRYSPLDLCLLDALHGGADPENALATCERTETAYPSEQTYSVEDVFDAELAAESLSQVSPGAWFVNLVPVPFGLGPDGSIDPVAAALTKSELRESLNEPLWTNPQTGEATTVTHPPLYRTLQVTELGGQPVTLTSSWERGLDFFATVAGFALDTEDGGLGIYEAIWPEAQVIDAPPYREAGVPTVYPHALILTPAPDGPRAEKWGTFPLNVTAGAALGLVGHYGAGGFWASVAGNEGAGGLMRRDFSQVLPQYVLGPHRNNGRDLLYSVMPDGSVRASEDVFSKATTSRSIDIGAPHWCDQWNEADPTQRAACRHFVRTTTTLQSIETLQHGLGYMHSEEPRESYHYDGDVGSFARLSELIADPTDTVGHLLHQMVNMYTTLGASHLWAQCLSDWNGATPHAGMQTSLYRSHAREAMAAAEDAISALQAAASTSAVGQPLLTRALKTHRQGIDYYEAWDYAGTLAAALLALSDADAGLTLLGLPDVVHDPLDVVGNPLDLPGISEQISPSHRAQLAAHPQLR